MSSKWVPKPRRIFPAKKIEKNASLNFSFIYYALLLLLGCATQPENPLVQPEKFAAIYTSLQIAAAQDSTVAVKMDSLLRQHGYTRVQFDEAVRYYNANAEAWAKVVEQNVARLDSLVRAEARQDSLRKQADGAHTP